MRNRLVVCILILSVCGCTLFGLGDPEYGWVLRSVDISPDELVVPRGAQIRVGVDLKTREHDLLPVSCGEICPAYSVAGISRERGGMRSSVTKSRTAFSSIWVAST